jgi:hypothetical protein
MLAWMAGSRETIKMSFSFFTASVEGNMLFTMQENGLIRIVMKEGYVCLWLQYIHEVLPPTQRTVGTT